MIFQVWLTACFSNILNLLNQSFHLWCQKSSTVAQKRAGANGLDHTTGSVQWLQKEFVQTQYNQT